MTRAGARIASVWIARTTMEESPDFERQKTDGTVPARPLLHALMNHRAGIVRAFAISALGSITYYVGITYVPSFLISTGKLDEGASLRLSTVAAVAVILVTPFAGALSDRLGRRTPEDNPWAQQLFLGQNPRLAPEDNPRSDHCVVTHTDLAAQDGPVPHDPRT